jgi:prolipoprotein diacylglyceryltransferase
MVFFSQESDENMNAADISVFKGLWWAFRYHLGSLCSGSLFIAFTTVIRFIFEFFRVNQLRGILNSL